MTTLLEEDIVSLLTTSPALTAYALSVPENGTYPCVVYQRISTNPLRTMSGNGLEKTRFQLTCWGKTLDSSLQTAKTVKTKFDLNQTNFVLATRENEFTAKEIESGLYSTVLDIFIWSSK